jgi:fructose/tagatose bisphosphate aldolase
MKTLRQTLQQAESDAVAIGHFNISDLVGLKGDFDSARELNVPVVVGTSEGEREFIGVRQAAAGVKSLREQYEFPIFLNADHTHSLKAAIEAAKAGYDWVVFDVSNQRFEQNIRQTKETVEGNRHGMSKAMAAGETRKHLNIDRIREIKAATHILMTLLGASGTDHNDLRQAIAAGMTVEHINTKVRLTWRRGFDDAFPKQPTEIVPYKILPHVVDTIKDVVKSRLELFNSGQTRVRSAFERG